MEKFVSQFYYQLVDENCNTLRLVIVDINNRVTYPTIKTPTIRKQIPPILPPLLTKNPQPNQPKHHPKNQPKHKPPIIHHKHNRPQQ